MGTVDLDHVDAGALQVAVSPASYARDEWDAQAGVSRTIATGYKQLLDVNTIVSLGNSGHSTS